MDSEEFRLKAQIHIEKFYPKVCPVCRQTVWALGEPIKFLRADSSKHYYPFFPYACRVCGFTYWVNATFAGFSFDQIEDYQGVDKDTSGTEEGQTRATS